ncbi:MAG TPA: pyridoxamine 5'-phosphate oxidase family protein [Acidimicrobiales bacterium]|nr:pyridoxamine 5'-phosphate oxidase family protein [Acidimicrobiales bacterium]
MSDDVLGPGPRTRVRRLAVKASYDERVIFAILDEAKICHVAAVVHGKPVALPTLHAREGRTLYLHGSPSNAVLKAVARAGEAYVTVTLFDGLRLARSGFESSIAYRSVVVVGSAREVDEASEKAKVLDLVVDRVLPGRASEVRPITDSELRRTMVVAVSIDEASAKLSSGPTEDDEEDTNLPIWAGSVPARIVYGAPIPDSNGAMASGDVATPLSVQTLLGRQ